MNKIETITKEQELLLPKYRRKWLDIGRSTKPLDRKKTTESIKWLYGFGGKKGPYVWFCDSPMQAELMINLLKDEKLLGDNLVANLWANLRTNLRANLEANLRANLGDNLWANLWDNLGDNLWANLVANLRTNLRANLWANLGDNLRANLGDNLRTNLRANLGDNLGDNLRANLGDKKLKFEYFFSPNLESYWVGFYDFILHELFPERKEEFKTFSNECIEFYKNSYFIIPFEGICFLSERPNKIHLNEEGRLHRSDGPSIEWLDGFSIYSLYGIRMDGQGWFFDPEISIDEKVDRTMKIENVEQRLVAIRELGMDKVLHKLESKSLDTKGDEYELFSVTIEGESERLLKMKNPSEDKWHYEFIAPECSTVNEALGWRIGIETNQFKEPVSKS